MEDEEYRAYLTKQSYEDLLSIENSLDKASHPARYAMVLKELDARGKQSTSRPLYRAPMRKVALLVGVMAGTIGVLSVCTGRANIKGGIRPILRSEHPFFFWTIVGVWFCGSVWSFYNGFKKEKKMKPNQASEDTARKFSDPPR